MHGEGATSKRGKIYTCVVYGVAADREHMVAVVMDKINTTCACHVADSMVRYTSRSWISDISVPMHLNL